MERTYTRGMGRRKVPPRRAARRRRGSRVELGPRERRRLSQLLVCLALFLAVFMGRGIFPEQMDQVGQELRAVIRSDTDLEAVFSSLGQVVHQGGPALEALETLWTGGRSAVWQPYPLTVDDASADQELSRLRAGAMLGAQLLEGGESGAWSSGPSAPEEGQTETDAASTGEEAGYDGPPPPENTTMEDLPLGLDASETVAPVMAAVSSPYGWREHPIDEEEKFHAGVDLAANYGEPIGAFADGTVDYIGESPAYGQYLQLRHAGGVTTFYAHCSKLCVQQGQEVEKGEKVAEVGDTGNVTGAHLHFEMKIDGVLVDPLYYIETE